MAAIAGTIDTSYVVLFDNWPGSTPEQRTIPYDFFTTAAARHNVAAANYYPIGAKVQVYDTTNNGFATLQYLQLGTVSGVAAAVAQVCTIAGGTDNASFYWYHVNNDGDDTLIAVGSPLAAIMLSAMTAEYYGWFWTGGVCPETFVSGLATTVSTQCEDSGSATVELFSIGDLTADSLGLIPVPSVGGPAGILLTVQTDSSS